MSSPLQLRDILARYGDPDPSLISKLPKGGNKDKNTWKNCRVCNGWHATNAVHLDYMGHAEVTRALLEIDENWTWEPIALDENGVPRIVGRGSVLELWIRLTVLGKTVLGVGTCDSSKPDASKELIGDALRNAAMRFGIGLALWSKAEWHADDTPAPTPTVVVSNTVTANTTTGEIIDDPFGWAHNEMMTATSVAALDAVANIAKHKLTDEERSQLRPIYLERKAELEGVTK